MNDSIFSRSGETALAVLVGTAQRTSELREAQVSIDELERLLETAGGVCFAKVMQIKETFDPRTCIGKGKVSEISDICHMNSIELVIFDFELSPAQIRNLEEDIGDVRVIDRSMLILDIFALHAKSGEGKLQVELAQLKYTAPRLTGRGTELSRQGGGIGTRGPGESKLESDRRHIKERIYALEGALRELERTRETMRASRDRSGLKKIAIVGYTNAGKSTLLNCLTDAGVLSEDKLFATLDPTTRRFEIDNGESVLLTDTVGFIRNLPHHLVKAFKSTLDEAVFSDIIMLVADVTDPEIKTHIEVTKGILEELGAADKPVITVYNKCDALADRGKILASPDPRTVFISARTGEGVDRLISVVAQTVRDGSRLCTLLIPYSDQSALSRIHDEYNVQSTDYTDDGILLKARLDKKGRGQYSSYIRDEE